MKASELRIGNLIIGAFDNTLKVTISQMVNLDNGFESIEPIPLTEEWLLKFGFKTDNKCWRKDIHIFEYELIKDDEFTFDVINVECNNWTVSVKYVHELQNLYFVLTGKELTL